jgi:hypothetical protein
LCKYITENGSFVDDLNGMRSLETSVDFDIFKKRENPFIGVDSQ